MVLKKIGIADADNIAPLAAAFRIQLKSYKGITSQPNIEAGREEILEFLESGVPVYAVEDSGIFVGYIVCKIDEPCLWVEHIFEREDYRRKGVATCTHGITFLPCEKSFVALIWYRSSFVLFIELIHL